MPVHRIGLLSDTHGHLHPATFGHFEGVEMILHAGDVCDEGILDELEALAPTFAVGGNCDASSPRLPPLRVIDAPFGKAVLTHSHLLGMKSGDAQAMARHFQPQSPRLILFGHTHLPLRRMVGSTWVVNPGPAGRPRLRDKPQITRLDWDSDGDRWSFVDLALDWPAVGGRR